jgi:lipopolysaccharide transport system permease protein
LNKKNIILQNTLINSKGRTFKQNLYGILEYRYLSYLFFKRNIAIYYKQTILGPLWFLIQPLLMTLVFLVVFNKIAQIDTGEIPPSLFYMSGIIIWTYFSDSLSQISVSFTANAGLFNKIYFPRLIMPISVLMTNIFKLAVQIFILLILLVIVESQNEFVHNITLVSVFAVIFYIILTSILSLGAGLIISSFTAKYKDLNHLVGFGIRLLMYLSPIIYPISSVPNNLKSLIIINPMTAPIQGFRGILNSSSMPSIEMVLYSFICSIVLLSIGLLLFFKTEKKFIDTI